MGWRFVEFPIVNALTALGFRLAPFAPLEILGRLTSVVFSLGALLLLYLLTRDLTNTRVGLLAAATFGVMPFNVYFHRTILPEVPLLFFSLLGLWTFQRWLETNQQGYYLSSLVGMAAGLLIKPTILFLAIPMLYLVVRKWRGDALRQVSLYLYIFWVLTPFLLWRLWVSRFPEGVPAYDWLLNGSGIRFRPAFFRWIFAERLGKLILGYWGLIPLGLGIIRKPIGKHPWFFHSWLLAVLMYLTIFATGNVTHDYYQIIVIPVIAIFVALGIDSLVHLPKRAFVPTLAWLLLGISIMFSLGFSWFHVRDFFNINHPEIVEAGQTANLILPDDALVIAPYQGDTAFLYQINRRGWPIGGELEKKKAFGATDYVTVVFDEEATSLLGKCKPTIRSERFAIINLRNCAL